MAHPLPAAHKAALVTSLVSLALDMGDWLLTPHSPPRSDLASSTRENDGPRAPQPGFDHSKSVGKEVGLRPKGTTVNGVGCPVVVGESATCDVGRRVGRRVGRGVGNPVGVRVVGCGVGDVGCCVGLRVGRWVAPRGKSVGAWVGCETG